MSVNKVILVGRLGKDPEVRAVGDTSVTNFSLATSRKYTKDGEKHEDTQWHNIDVWGKMGEVCAQYLSKGREVYVEGEIQYRKFEKDGDTKYFTSIRASTVQFLGGGGSKDSPSDAEGEDVPF